MRASDPYSRGRLSKREIYAFLREEEFTSERFISGDINLREWLRDHVDTNNSKDFSNVDIRTGQPTLERIMKKISGSGIEHAQYIWWDEDTDLWFYGVDEDEIS